MGMGRGRDRAESAVVDDVGLLTRRTFLRGAGAAIAATGAAGLLQACLPGSSASPSGSSAAAASGTTPVGSAVAGRVTLGSNQSDAVPKQALGEVVDAFISATGIDVKVNTVDHATFQNQIAPYLQGRPDDVITWFAGNRMRFFAERGLVGDVSEVWNDVGSRYGDGIRTASSGTDGKPYFVPFYMYPWVILYRRSAWQRLGYAPPQTFDQLIALSRRMASDGLVPIAFGDKDGWPAMGFFDILEPAPERLRLPHRAHGRA